jgi:hypothetical protein
MVGGMVTSKEILSKHTNGDHEEISKPEEFDDCIFLAGPK